MLCCYVGGKFFALAAPLPGLNYAVAVLFPLLLLIGLLFVCLGLALLFGFPLLVAAIAVEGSDAFDAVSRMYSYLRLRPLHYIFYTVCLTALGMLTYIVLSLLLDLAAGFAGRFVPGLQDFAVTGLPTLVLSPHLLEGAGAATWIGAAWLSLFFLIKTAFTFTFFWTGAVAVYLLLRKSVDNAPLDEVYRMPQITPTNPTGDTSPLPAPEIVTDEKGMPELKIETKN